MRYNKKTYFILFIRLVSTRESLKENIIKKKIPPRNINQEISGSEFLIGQQ